MNTWPINNRSDSLQIDFFHIQRQVGKKLGYSFNPAEWNDVQDQMCREIIDAGCRLYYYPDPLPSEFTVGGVAKAHHWSFMRPIWRFETAASQSEYPLPDDFEHPIGSLSYQASENNFYEEIPITSMQRIMKLENRLDFTSHPLVAAIRPDESTGEGPQRYLLVLHPIPDATYKLQLQYQSQGRRLSEDQPYPMGGQSHGRGVLAACLAEAEYSMLGQYGGEYSRFVSILAGNIVRDTEKQAAILGYNGNMDTDRVRGRGSIRADNLIWSDDVTYNV